ncbi:hypothetical protein FRC07_007307 [Ceratobasidium sp. 392]|nr:hypothetical protein FRC07_007307 [Ceratobasidium sp. 392]
MAAAREVDKDDNRQSNRAKSGPSRSAPRKRARTNEEVSRGPKRRNKSSLKRMLDMPPEVFHEIATHLTPADLLSLARTSKFFRKIFISRSSRPIWQAAFHNIPNAPPCPPELNEPQYASLLFSKTCTRCGAKALRRVDPISLVRLCNTCLDEELVKIPTSDKFFSLVPHGGSIVEGYDLGFAFTHRSDIEEVSNAAKNKKTFPAWAKARQKRMKERRKEAERLRSYLNELDHDRESELKDLKKLRKQQIEARLLEKGWKKRDMDPSPENASEWHKLVWQPKPLTDRIWNNMYPKLVPMLKSNRKHNEVIDKKNRRYARISRLREIVDKIRLALPPLVHVTQKQPAENDSTNEAGTSTAPAFPAPSSNRHDVKAEIPFPSIAELLTWPIIEDVIETDTQPEEVEASFNEIRDEFDQAVIEWREKVEQDLVDIWNAGRTEDHEDETKPGPSTSKGKGKGKAAERNGARRSTRTSKGRKSATRSSSTEVSVELVLPEFTATFGKPDGTTTQDISELSPNLQLLLRADTLFRVSIFYSYPAIVPPAEKPHIVGCPPEELFGKRWDPKEATRYDEGSAMARKLLARVGRPDATAAEMKALGGNFMCGRCNRNLPERWQEIVVHYTWEELRWKQAEAKMKEDPKSRFVYHNIHDLSPSNPKPFAHFITPQAAADITFEDISYDSMLMTCKPCEQMGIEANFCFSLNPDVDLESPIEKHLQNVHDIADPCPGQHFYRSINDIELVDPFPEEEDEEDEEDVDDSEDGENEENENREW